MADLKTTEPNLLEPAKKSTYIGEGAKAGAAAFALANLLKPAFKKKLSKGNLPVKPGTILGKSKPGKLVSTAASAIYGGLVGGLAGAFIPKQASYTHSIKEIEHTMINKELQDACALLKTAADMTIPLDKKPVPEAGSEPVAGLTNNATANPTSEGAQVYGDTIGAMTLAKAKEKAQCLLAKAAAARSEENQKYSDRLVRDVGMSSTTGVAANLLGSAAIAASGRGKSRLALGLGAGAAAAGLASLGYGARGLYDAYNQTKTRPEKTASAEEIYAEKLASVQETGVTPDEAYMAAEAAVEMYNDALEKQAFAEEMWAQADSYFATLEKQAGEYAPVAGSTLGAAAGATAGLAAAQRFLAGRPIAQAAVTATGAALGAAAPTALEHFAAAVRN